MKKETRLTLAIVLSLTFMVFEITGGIWANSLAILSDAAHLLTDVAGFAIACWQLCMLMRLHQSTFHLVLPELK
jgi:Co/Zn/Cd efflux system component